MLTVPRTLNQKISKRMFIGAVRSVHNYDEIYERTKAIFQCELVLPVKKIHFNSNIIFKNI